jgi:Cu(I)/Ag(I) efflux system membrane protein CusA/SilA
MQYATGYLKSLEDFRNVPVGLGTGGTPILLSDVARIQIGPELRRGISELDGKGEAVGGVIIMRAGKNALETIGAVKAKIASLEASLPAGVEIVPTYDRSDLIHRSVATLRDRLIEEFIVVTLVCALFLFHLRSAFVPIVSLPLGILAAFTVMNWQGVNANIMSLGGIAIAIGAMVDAAVVMIENAHKHLEAWNHENPDRRPTGAEQARLIAEAAAEVGPALFFSLLIITLSFMPVFTLEAQEGKLFGPLAFTKTYSMAAAAGLSVTLIPVLMFHFVRGRIPDERSNPINRVLISLYRPLLDFVLRHPRTILTASGPVVSRCHRAADPTRERIHATPGRRRSAVYALGTPGAVRRQGLPATPANRQGADAISRSSASVRQGRSRRNGNRSRGARDVRNHDPVQTAVRMAERHDSG